VHILILRNKLSYQINMAINYDLLQNYPPKEEDVVYDSRDTMLYALAIGLGFDPTDRRQLPFVYERDLVAFPTMAMALGHPGWWLGSAGLDASSTVHASKKIEILGTLPIEGKLHTRSVVTGVTDKGVGKHALVHTQRDLWDSATGHHLSRQINTIIARGQGGFGGPNPVSAPPVSMPSREPDAICSLPTISQQALFYRLCGDRHPLHVDPELALAGGFSRPILHGLASMGIAAHAVIRTACDYQINQVKTIECRFTNPVYPGDALHVRMWYDEPEVLFQVSVLERAEIVIDQGRLELRDHPTSSARHLKKE